MHLVLSTRSLLGCDDAASFITAFSGSHRYVVNYLLDEDLNGQSKAIQDFLAHANLFLVPLDAERRWYRYRHLFAQALYQPSGYSRRLPHWSRTYTVA